MSGFSHHVSSDLRQGSSQGRVEVGLKSEWEVCRKMVGSVFHERGCESVSGDMGSRRTNMEGY